jgi:3-hydroxybutyryl-CoA dehydrogenase
MDVKGRIAIVGAGLMGTAIATLCAAQGYTVALHDQNQQGLDSFRVRATPIASFLAGASDAQNDILGRVELHPSLESSVRDATLVHEIIHEDLDAKRALFKRLDALCADDVMLGTNTSSFLLSEICADLPGRRRVVGIHYVAPAHLIRAVEIITADFTDPTIVARARQFLDSIDRVGVACRECPGFLINRIQYALKAEVQKIVEENVASVEDIDAVVRLSIGPRLALWGPMMQEDLSTSKKTVLAVTEYIHKATGNPHFASTAVLRRLAESGQTGASAGAGWYRWGADNDRIVRERDRQLGELLDWLKAHDRVAALGAKGENEHVRRRD